MLLYHFPLTSSSATETIVNKGLKDDYTISGDNNFSSGGKLSAYAKDMGENKFYLSIPNFSLDYTLCFRAKATSNILLVSVGYTPFEITADNTWHDYVICDKKVYKDGLFLTNYNYSAGIVAFGDSEDSCQGMIQDIRIYDYALSQAEINEYSRALVVHYPLNGSELSPSVLKDVSGFGNDATLNRGYALMYKEELIRGERCIYNDDIYNKFRYVVPNFYPPRQLSMAMWFKVNSNTAIVMAIHIFRNVRNGMYWNGANSTLYGYIEAPTSTGTWINGLNDNNWHHIVFTFVDNNNGTVQCLAYKDGVLHRSTLVEESTARTEQTLELAHDSDSNVKFAMCDFRVYATVLTEQQIKDLYNSPVSLTNKHQLTAFKFMENPLFPSKYWHTPTYDEMNYILNTRPNASNLRTLGRVQLANGTYVNGCFLLPDDWVLPSGVTMTITNANYTTNSYTLEQFNAIEKTGGVFFPECGIRIGTSINYKNDMDYYTGTYLYRFAWTNANDGLIVVSVGSPFRGYLVRLCKPSNSTHSFSTSATTKIGFAPANLQYHCTQHIWRFAEHSYDVIGQANENISDAYDGWIDLFGYGTSGVNYSPTMHTTNNSDYASGDISNTDNDWGINEIQSYDYNVKNFAANKNGIVQHNELRENDSDVNGCYNDKLITNELIEQ